MTKTYEITANGTAMGEYRGADESAAIDAYARDAGYEDFADLLKRVDGSSRDELDVAEIDTEKLVAAVESAAGEAVFQDSCGDGVALVKHKSYATYRDLADAFDLDIETFRRSAASPVRRVTGAELTDSGVAKLNAFLDGAAKPGVSRQAVTFEVLDVLADRAGMAESYHYELGHQYTTSGRPEILVLTADDVTLQYDEE